jgi:hypothetical protein
MGKARGAREKPIHLVCHHNLMNAFIFLKHTYMLEM